MLLAEHFLRRYAQAHGLVPKRLSREAETWLQGYSWPGNVRELSYLLERVTLLSTAAVVSASTLEELCLPQLAGRVGATPPQGVAEPLDEAARLRQALGQTEGNVVRAAIHLGQVLVDVQAHDPTARLLPWGETLSLPVRLLGHAVPGDILLSPLVGRLVEGWFEVQVREGAVGGEISIGVGAYAVEGVGAELSPLEVYGKRPLSRFVGRERELAMLCDLLAPDEKGHGQVVGIVGEPGVGKSRLCYEVTQIQRTHGWLILESSPVAYGKETPYLPIIDLLKAYCQLDAREEQQTVRDKVAGKLHTLDEGLTPSLPALLALLDAPIEDRQWQALDPPQRRQRTLEALKRLWLRESQIQPVLLVVENLHWIDSETQAFLDSLVDGLPTARLLLLVNYRPEYQHGWGGKTYYTQLRLDPLSPEHAEVLLRDLLGDDPGLALLKRHLIERSAGNPFFLEESVRTLVETQVLVGEPAAYRLGPAQPTLRVPGTVQGVLAGRLQEAQSLAECALEIACVHQERGHQAYALRLLGDIAARPAPPYAKEAEAYYREALTLADELGMRPLQAHCHLALGTLYAKIGQPEQADAALSAAVALYRAMDMTFWLPQAEAALAQLEEA